MIAPCESIRRRRLLAAAVPLLTLAGCGLVTQTLYRRQAYKEDFSRVYMTSDESAFVVIGRQYHYVFGLPPGLRDVLLADWRKRVRPVMDDPLQSETRHFQVDSEGKIRGNVLFLIEEYDWKGLTPEQQESVVRAGFKQEHTFKSWRMDLALSGKRYSANGISPSDPSNIALNRPYWTRITEPHSATGMAARIAATPIALAADGALTLLAVPLMPFVFAWGGGHGGP